MKAHEIRDVKPVAVRTFESGATRDTDMGKPDYDGFLSPLVIQRIGTYMLKHQRQSDGQLRASDNWQKGIPLTAYMKSAWRHFLDLWLIHRGHRSAADLEDVLCAVLFNVMGYLHEVLKEKNAVPLPPRHESSTPKGWENLI